MGKLIRAIKKMSILNILRLSKYEEGLYLSATRAYLERALDVVQVAGIGLIQLCWQHYAAPEESEVINRSFSKCVYDALVAERYDVVKSLAEFSEHLMLSDDTRLYIFVDYAIALRDTNPRSTIFRLLNEKRRDGKQGKLFQYKSTKLPIRIAWRMLQGETKGVMRMLSKALDNGSIDILARHWPLFKPIWNDAKFQAIFNARLGKEDYASL
jgi:hypothetical protein